MEIKRKVLKKSVTIMGKDIFGRSAEIIFTPTRSPGWYLFDHSYDEETPLDRCTIFFGKNNLYAENSSSIMHVLEHIMSLRWFGLDNVCLSGSRWPPNLSTKEYWDYLINENAVSETDQFIAFYVVVYHPCGSLEVAARMTVIQNLFLPGGDIDYIGFSDVEINVHIDYPGVGCDSHKYTLEDFEKVCAVYTQGYPLYRYYVCRLLSLFGWPHFKKVVWAQNQSDDQTLKLWRDHRALDIFGALAMIDYQKLPSGIIVDSTCSGHKYDLIAINNASYSSYVKVTKR